MQDPTDRHDHDEAPLSERLREIAEARTTPWPEDDYVPRENPRGRDPVVDSIGHGAILQGGAARL